MAIHNDNVTPDRALIYILEFLKRKVTIEQPKQNKIILIFYSFQIIYVRTYRVLHHNLIKAEYVCGSCRCLACLHLG